MLTSTTRRYVRRICFTIVAALFGLSIDRPALAGPLALTRIAASAPGSGLEYAIAPAISENGTVAYIGNPGPGTAATGVYRYQTGSASLVAPASATGGIYSAAGLGINDAGTIVFQDFNALYSVTAATITPIATPGIGSGKFVTYPSIAQDGTVIYALRDSFDSVTVKLASGGTTDDIASSTALRLTQFYAGFNEPGQVPVISDNGNAAYLWIGADGETPRLDFRHGGTTTTIASLATPLGSVNYNVNNDSVTFFGQPIGEALGLYVSDGNGLAPVPLQAGLMPVRPLAYNNPGDIAFMGNLGGHTFGIFTTDAMDPLIKIGDPLDGSTVAGINLGPHGLNDNGQLVFSALLANGSSGVYLLSPVPEPSSLALLAVGAACIAAGALRRRGRR